MKNEATPQNMKSSNSAENGKHSYARHLEEYYFQLLHRESRGQSTISSKVDYVMEQALAKETPEREAAFVRCLLLAA